MEESDTNLKLGGSCNVLATQDMGIHSDNGSMVHCLPEYNKQYISETLISVDTQSIGNKPYYRPTGYIQPSISCPEASMSYNCDSMDNSEMFHEGDVLPAVAESNACSAGSSESSESKHITTKVSLDMVEDNVSNPSFNSRSTISVGGFSNSPHGQPIKPSNRVSTKGSNFQKVGQHGLLKPHHPVGKTIIPNQGHGGPSQHRLNNMRSTAPTKTANDRFNMRVNSNINGFSNSSYERNCGPRATKSKDTTSLSTEKDQLGLMIRREQYNQKDFQTKYEQAMFFVIKSFSEDDVHKSIKYNVWSSTPRGNEKLNAAFHNAERKANERGTTCPIFLFFSVNGSGQFIGLAEMIGQVDFKKNMDFWQEDKWNGFFPVKWHMIKDIPNREFLHIILEDNDHKPVTFSRDTQEIKFMKGLQMLKIFKDFRFKTSILDDFNFYEAQAKSKQDRKPFPPPGINSNMKSSNLEARARNVGTSTGANNSFVKVKPSSLVTLTKNLSLYP